MAQATSWILLDAQLSERKCQVEGGIDSIVDTFVNSPVLAQWYSQGVNGIIVSLSYDRIFMVYAK